jgi:acetoin utilization protein AcuB
MPDEKAKEEAFLAGHGAKQTEKNWVEELYLLRRQRKAILENCRRIAVTGASSEPDSVSFVGLETLLAKGLEIIPIFPGRESLLGLRCYPRLSDVPGKIDIVQVYPSAAVDCGELAKVAVEKQVATFWMEPGLVASPETKNILSRGKVQLVEYEELMTEYLKHNPFFTDPPPSLRKNKRAARVKERMSKNPATIQPNDGLKDAVWKMEHGHFRHLPVVDEKEKLVGMLTDRDVRLIRPSLAFASKEDAAVQLWSISVQQAAVFDPISVKPETTLKEAAELMMRWHVGGLPVVDEREKVVGMVTYTDILREFVGCDEP